VDFVRRAYLIPVLACNTLIFSVGTSFEREPDMSFADVFRSRYEELGEYADRFLGMEEETIQAIPAPARTSIAWQWWHLTRTEDIGLNRLVMNRAQVFDQGSWGARLGAVRRDIGMSMSAAEASEVTGQLSLAELRAYREAVTAATNEALERIDLVDLSAPQAEEVIDRALLDEGMVVPKAYQTLADYFRGKSKAWMLGHFCVSHPFLHVGQSRMLYRLIFPPERS
jgi:hypothetical protein